MQPLNYKPFTFKNFSEPEPGPEFVSFAPAMELEPQTPPPPTFSEEELLAARQEGEQAGRQQGRQEALSEMDAEKAARDMQLLGMLEMLAGRIDAEIASYREHREAERGNIAGIIMMIARKMAGNALAEQPLGPVETIVNDCLTMMAGEARLSVAVHPDIQETLAVYLQGVQREGQAIEVIGDKNLRQGDCRIQWPGGKAERNQEILWTEMEAIVNRAFSSSSENNVL